MSHMSVPGADIAGSVTVQEAAQRLRDGSGTLLIDVRERREYESVRADGAALLPLSQFMARYTVLPRDRTLMLICRTGVRSLQAARFLAGQGYTDVINVVGGTNAWHLAGLPVRRGPAEPGESGL
jgi:rhodanese-related sulfurtransferase